MDKQTKYSVEDLRSSDPNQVSQAANSLYASRHAAEIFSSADAGNALAEAAGNGNRTAAVVLLLGLSPKGSSVLARLTREHGEENVKLHDWSRPVPLRIAATAALSRAGDSAAHLALLQGIPGYPDPVRVFLLDILPYIEDPAVWHELAEYMKDNTEIPEDVPSHAARRRVADHAVEAFLHRLPLDVSFEQNPGGRYSKDQIEETLRRFHETVPR